MLDTAQLFTDLSIDNATTSKRFMKGMKWLSQQLGCTVLGITHPVPKGHGVMGLPGTQLKALADFVWQVQADESSTEDDPRSVVIAEKLKSSSLFRPIAYRLEKIHWKQPPVDPETEEELDVPEDEYELVGSVTVRLCEDEQPGSSPAQAPARSRKPLPEAIPGPAEPRRHIRTGIKPQAPFRTVHLPAPAIAPAPVTPVPRQDPVPEPAQIALDHVTLQPDPDAAGLADRAKLVTALVSVPCPVLVCKAAPGESCAPGGTAVDYVVLGKMPLIIAHVERLGAAVATGKANLDDVLAQFDGSPASAEMAGASS